MYDSYIQFLLGFCLFGIMSRCQSFQLKYLNSLISEYEDCDVTLLIVSPSFSLATFPPIPVRIYNYSGFASVGNVPPEIRKGQFQFPLFVFTPEFKLNGVEGHHLEFEKFHIRYTEYISLNHDVFINVFLGRKANLRFKPSAPNSKNHYLTIFEYTEENGSWGEKVYVISTIHALLIIPGSAKVFNRAFPIVRAILPYCVQAAGSFCRREIKKKLNNIFYGGPFYVDHFSSSADLRQVYVHRAVNASNYNRLADIIRDHFKSPYKKKDKIYGLTFAVLTLEALDGWILKRNPKLDVLEGFLTKYVSNFGMGMTLVTPVTRGYEYRVEKSLNYLLVHFGYDYMNFITCDGVRQDISFNFYMAPYDYGSWLTIFGFSFIMLPLTVWVLFQSRLQTSISADQHLNLLIDLVYFNISFGLDVGAELPNVLKKAPRALENANRILGLWILLLIVLVNAYKGIVTTELTAAAAVTTTHFNITKMDGFTYFVSAEFFQILQETDIREALLNFGTRVADVPNLRACVCNPDIPEAVPIICASSSFSYCSSQLYSRCPETDTCEEVNSKLESIGIQKMRPTRSKSFCTYERGHEAIQAWFEQYRGNKTIAFHSTSHYCGSMTAINQFKWRRNSSLLFPFKTAFIYSIPEIEGNNVQNNKPLMPLPPGVNKSSIRKHVLDLTSKCAKTAYVGRELEVDTFRAYAERPENGGLRYRKGDKIYTFKTGWALTHDFPLAPTLYKRMLLLVAFGIEQIWTR